MTIRTRKMNRAVNELSKYFGLSSIRDLIATSIREERTQAAISGDSTSTSGDTPETVDSIISTILNQLIDTTSGCPLTYELISTINSFTTDATEEQKNAIKNYLEIYYGPSTDPNSFLNVLESMVEETYAAIVGPSNFEGDRAILESDIINQNLSNPTKDNPGLSVILSNSTRISPTVRNTNAVCVFMNGISNIEFSRALPYAEIKFFLPRPVIDTTTNRVQGLSLIKFLLGAQSVANGTPTYQMLSANTITGSLASQFPQSEQYTIAGMEIFTSPQTLVNADEIDDPQLRANPVLDKFRPFLTIKDLTIEVRPSTGLASFKTAKLAMVLHDRSRLNDIADFVKADLYSANEIEIEYGWIHPENFLVTNVAPNNPYGDLINGMRVKERYGIINSSFSFTEGGNVDINLELAMRGGSDLSTELIDSGITADSVNNSIRQLRDLQANIARLRDRVFGSETSGTSTREIRGIQALDAAMTATSNFRMTSELTREYRDLHRRLNDNNVNSATRELRDALENFYNNISATNREERTDGNTIIEEIRTTIIEGIEEKIRKMSINTPDAFLRPDSENDQNPAGGTRAASVDGRVLGGPRNSTRLTQYRNRYQTDPVQGTVSLATLLLHFVGQPLANTKKYDEVQMLFYPFNSKAGYARKINVASFRVDLDFFSQELARNRLEAASNSVAMNIREFFTFLQSTIIDDPAAPSYGLWDSEGSFYRENIEDGVRRTESRYEVPALQGRMESILSNVTPDGTFQMPQIEIYVECIPQRIGTRDGDEIDESTAKSILRLHVYDRVANCYESQGQILRATRDNEIAALGRSNNTTAPDENNSSPVEANQEADARANLQRALDLGLLEIISPTGTVNNTSIDALLSEQNLIRVAGGSRALKNFLYQTVPYIIYGIQGTAVKQANLSSMQNSQLSTVNMLRSPRNTQLQPNGEQPGGLPMQVIPAELNLTTLGCPLIQYAQQFFIDFQTGTSLDNIYGVTGLTHKISPGNFTTDIKFAPFDAYGQYYNTTANIRNQITVVERALEQQNGTGASATPPTE